MPHLPLCRSARATAITACFVALLAGPAQAEQLISKGFPPDDPLIAWAEASAGRNHFFLNDDRDVEIIRFRAPRDVEMCAGPAKRDDDGRLRPFPIRVSWDSQTAVIAAGNCLSFDAQRVSVRSAAALPDDMVLEGTYRVSK
jgi:hypothetical protein